MEVYAVAAWHQYYPNGNNIKEIFSSYQKAEEYLKEFRDRYESEYVGYYDYYEILTLNINTEE